MDRSRSAFTLIEILVVVAVAAALSALAITYTGIGRNEVALTIEESKIAQFILQAKSLSIATYGTAGTGICGYGFLIDPQAQTYSIFAYAPSGAPPCPDAAQVTGLSAGSEQSSTPGTWQVPVAQGVKIVPGAGALDAVLFYPPDPTVLFSTDGVSFASAPTGLSINLATVDGKNTATLTVNPEGQVTF